MRLNWYSCPSELRNRVVTACALIQAPALPLQIHGIQILRTRFTSRHGTGDFQKPVGKCGFAVVDEQ